MKKSITLLAVAGLVLALAPAVQADMLGNLATDYADGTTGQTSDDVGISGDGGTWQLATGDDNGALHENAF
ncbi:MAG: hypothetical protein ISS69_05605 [Phycisphaerae bacterium]|nr:hypothetical protein [Phycisphaerae bacterium]